MKCRDVLMSCLRILYPFIVEANHANTLAYPRAEFFSGIDNKICTDPVERLTDLLKDHQDAKTKMEMNAAQHQQATDYLQMKSQIDRMLCHGVEPSDILANVLLSHCSIWIRYHNMTFRRDTPIAQRMNQDGYRYGWIEKQIGMWLALAWRTPRPNATIDEKLDLLLADDLTAAALELGGVIRANGESVRYVPKF